MTQKIDPRLPLLQDARIEGKVILLRVDHNVVKKGEIQDPFRIDQTFGTLFNIVERGGRPIVMTHVGRPRTDSGIIIDENTSVQPIVDYLENRLHTTIHVPSFDQPESTGLTPASMDSLPQAIRDLKKKKVGALYLPNTRWFEGEEADPASRVRQHFTRYLTQMADVFVNDAFGSWRPHASTADVAQYLPSCAGYLMQQEISHLYDVLQPRRPFVAVVAGAKFDTKINPLYGIYEKVDSLILGGLIYNTYLCAKYGVSIEGIGDEDIQAAKNLVKLDESNGKILELPSVVESETMEGKIEGKYRTVRVSDFKKGDKFHYIVDIARESFDDPSISKALSSAHTIFVNAVMGYTPFFTEGSATLDEKIDQNERAMKLYGGGDTLQEFKSLCPGLYLSVLYNAQYYFFTGGGAVLKAIEAGTPWGLKPIQALINSSQNGGRTPTR
jgi:phosphoglycerate kinase